MIQNVCARCARAFLLRVNAPDDDASIDTRSTLSKESNTQCTMDRKFMFANKCFTRPEPARTWRTTCHNLPHTARKSHTTRQFLELRRGQGFMPARQCSGTDVCLDPAKIGRKRADLLQAVEDGSLSGFQIQFRAAEGRSAARYTS